MQDKKNIENVVQEIMGLIDDWSEKDFRAAEARLDPWSEHDPAAPMQMLEKLDKEVNDARALIESKLRELVEDSFSVREPLSDAEIKEYIGVERGNSNFVVLEAVVRATERAHNITKDS